MLSVFGLAFALSFGLTPLVRRLALRTGLVDRPGFRRMHARLMPRGGGVAIYAAFWLAVGLCSPNFDAYWGLWLASTVILAVGLIDDRVSLPWYAKLAGQLVGALIFAVWGGRIEFVTHPLSGAPVYIGAWGWPLTLLWLVSLANMVNLIDGLDGLAAGVAAIACVPLMVVALSLGRAEAALLTAALAAATLGFLPHNFHPARIIMGDSGALFLGFALGAISVEGALKGPTTLAFVVPVLALGLPIFETLFSIVRRLAAGRPVYEADADHLHHRLLGMGLSHRQAVVTLYGVSALMGASALLARDASAAGGLGLLGLVALAATLFAVRLGGLAGAQAGLSQTRHPGL